MPLGIITESEAESELKNKTEIKELERGRGLGKTNVPPSLKKIIQESSIVEGRKKGVELAEKFGVSSSSVDAYKRGETTLGGPKDVELVHNLNKTKERIAETATDKIKKALSLITDDKLGELSPNKAAVFARDLAAVTKVMSPESNEGGVVGPNFIIYAPKMKSETQFEVIDLKEE